MALNGSATPDIGLNAAKTLTLGLSTGLGAIGPGVGVGYIMGKTIEAVAPPARAARRTTLADLPGPGPHRGDHLLRALDGFRRLLHWLARCRSRSSTSTWSRDQSAPGTEPGADGLDPRDVRIVPVRTEQVRVSSRLAGDRKAPSGNRREHRRGRTQPRRGPAAPGRVQAAAQRGAEGSRRPARARAQGRRTSRRGVDRQCAGAARAGPRRPGRPAGRPGAPGRSGAA